jgi:hypothetical protein
MYEICSYILFLIGGSILLIFLVALTKRIFRKSSIYLIVVLITLLTAPIIGVLTALLFMNLDGFLELGVLITLTYACLGGFFFIFVGMPNRSITLRLLMELNKVSGYELSMKELEKIGGINSLLSSRLSWLKEIGYLDIDNDGKIRLISKGLRMGSLVTRGRMFFKIGRYN